MLQLCCSNLIEWHVEQLEHEPKICNLNSLHTAYSADAFGGAHGVQQACMIRLVWHMLTTCALADRVQYLRSWHCARLWLLCMRHMRPARDRFVCEKLPQCMSASRTTRSAMAPPCLSGNMALAMCKVARIKEAEHGHQRGHCKSVALQMPRTAASDPAVLLLH